VVGKAASTLAAAAALHYPIRRSGNHKRTEAAMTWMTLLYSALIGFGTVALTLLWFYLIGLCLPRRQRRRAERMLTHSVEEAWERLTDFSAYPRWQPWLSQVERLSDKGGTVGVVWRHTEKKGEHLDLEVSEWVPDRKLVLRTADPALPFRGTWTLELEPCLGGCRVCVVEDSEIPGPLLRSMWRLFGPRRSSAERFLEALAKS
jgi:uncharacterized protein YndB with AHSA1/START domain